MWADSMCRIRMVKVFLPDRKVTRTDFFRIEICRGRFCSVVVTLGGDKNTGIAVVLEPWKVNGA